MWGRKPDPSPSIEMFGGMKPKLLFSQEKTRDALATAVVFPFFFSLLSSFQAARIRGGVPNFLFFLSYGQEVNMAERAWFFSLSRSPERPVPVPTPPLSP